MVQLTTQEVSVPAIATLDNARTSGKPGHDSSLHNNLNHSTAEITKIIYDLRKAPQKHLTVQFHLF
jgi:hypothetical protein